MMTELKLTATRRTSRLRASAKYFVAIVVVGALYGLAQPRHLSDVERRDMVQRFRFSSTAMPRLAGISTNVRPTHPSLASISGWISAVGASVALYDLDGDGLANDACYV